MDGIKVNLLKLTIRLTLRGFHFGLDSAYITVNCTNVLFYQAVRKKVSLKTFPHIGGPLIKGRALKR